MVRLAAAAVLLCGALPIAQESPPPVYRVGSELVVIDLVPTDRSQRFVDDLQPHEIQILEDGKPQKLEFVHRVRVAGRSGTGPVLAEAAPTGAGAAASPVPSAVPATVPDPVRVAIVVDLLTTPPQDLPRVQDAILRLVSDDLPAGTEMMLAALWHGMTIRQPFTADRVALAAAVKSLPLPTEGPIGFLQMMDTAQQQCETGAAPLPQLIGMGKSFIAETRQQLTATSAALSALTRAVAILPGRKHVVLYSRGYAFNAITQVIEVIATLAATCGGDSSAVRRQVAEQLAADEGFDAGPRIRALVDSANRSQVSFYAVDPRGLVVTSAQAKDNIPARATRSGFASRVAALEATLPQEYLRTLAGDTGGRAFLNTNDLTAGLRRAWADASEYYLLGYVPPAGRKRGRFHKIEVRVARPGVDLRFRRGYQDATDSDLRSADIEKALTMPGVFEHSGLDAEGVVTGGTLRVTAYIPPSAIRFRASDGVSTADLSVHAALWDPQGKLVGGKALFGRDIAMRLKPDQLKALMDSDNVEIPVEVAAPRAGTYRLVVAAREGGGWLGARTVVLVVN